MHAWLMTILSVNLQHDPVTHFQLAKFAFDMMLVSQCLTCLGVDTSDCSKLVNNVYVPVVNMPWSSISR